MLTSKEIKRQEAIFELSQGEEDLIEDLKLAKKAYHDPMLKLSIMSEQELNQIFGTLDSLIPLHEDLLTRLKEIRKPDGSTDSVGHILVCWLPCLNSYDSYCSNQVAAKALLDHKKQDHRVQDFLQRCLESPFSRKLDLWNFLDIPRSRLVKYPLLLREILRHTPNDNPDQQHLEEAINIVQGIVAEINKKTGESECQYYKERLIYLDEGQKDSQIDDSRVVCCHGELKNNRGAKLHVFLFQEVLVITRAVTQNEQLCYQLYRQPIPVKDLVLEDLQDGEVRLGGSIRGAFSNNERIKNFFRVSFKNGSQAQSHSLQANDAFNKQQWLNCIRQAKESVLCTSGQGGIPDSKGPLLTSSSKNRVPRQESKLEQMDQSDSGSDCSMDTSELSIECDHMEQTDTWENNKALESNV
ncbi:rho guanine nucleotide exchange factor 3 isoform X5 [Elgaria multicarinata webbii]